MTDITHGVRETHALLADGRTVEIRRARPEDHHQAERLYEEMSAENLRLRFFGVSRLSGRTAADRLCALPQPGNCALIAAFGGRIVGVAEYEIGADPTSAEIALAVADDFHHDGAGTLLLEHLVHAARQNGHGFHRRRPGRQPPGAQGVRRPGPEHHTPLRRHRGPLHHPARPGRALPGSGRRTRPYRRHGESAAVPRRPPRPAHRPGRTRPDHRTPVCPTAVRPPRQRTGRPGRTGVAPAAPVATGQRPAPARRGGPQPGHRPARRRCCPQRPHPRTAPPRPRPVPAAPAAEKTDA